MKCTHNGRSITLKLSFEQAFQKLQHVREISSFTASGSPFIAWTDKVTGGHHKGETVIKFRNPKKSEGESSRAYECCWGQSVNCNRTYLGMYCTALVKAMSDI